MIKEAKMTKHKILTGSTVFVRTKYTQLHPICVNDVIKSYNNI